MVILEQHAVRQAGAVVAAAAHADGVLLKHAVVRAGLAGVQQGDAGALQQGCDLMGVGGNAAHPLQIVQRHALAGEQDADIAVDNAELLTVFDRIAVLAEELDLGGGVQQGKDARKDIQTGNDAVLLGDQVNGAGAGAGHNGVGGHILAGHILPQGPAAAAGPHLKDA